MSIYKGTTQVAGIPTGLINTVNSKADASNVYTKTEIDTKPQITAPYLKETYENGASGYNIWSNGYCEQWGQNDTYSPVTGYTVTFLKTFKDTNYHISLTNFGGETDYDWHTVISRTKSTMVLAQKHSALWKASGYLESGQY